MTRSARLLFALALVVASLPAPAQAPPPPASAPTVKVDTRGLTMTLDVQPRTFTVPAMLTVTWNAAGASDCTASGGWAGSKAPSGSEQVAGALGSTSFYLDCIGNASPVTVSWTNPSKNLDGTNYSNAKHSEIYRASTVSGLPNATAVVVPAAQSSYQFAGLLPGAHHFALKAVSLTNAKSDLSDPASATLQVSSGAATPVTVTGSGEEPPPPTGVVATAVEAYAVKPNETLIDYLLDGQVGTVEVGIPCDVLREMGSSGYYAVNRAQYVTWSGNRRPKTVVAKCAPPP